MTLLWWIIIIIIIRTTNKSHVDLYRKAQLTVSQTKLIFVYFHVLSNVYKLIILSVFVFFVFSHNRNTLLDLTICNSFVCALNSSEENTIRFLLRFLFTNPNRKYLVYTLRPRYRSRTLFFCLEDTKLKTCKSKLIRSENQIKSKKPKIIFFFFLVIFLLLLLLV